MITSSGAFVAGGGTASRQQPSPTVVPAEISTDHFPRADMSPRPLIHGPVQAPQLFTTIRALCVSVRVTCAPAENLESSSDDVALAGVRARNPLLPTAGYLWFTKVAASQCWRR